VKSRRARPLTDPWVVPHSDGAGIIEAVGAGVSEKRIGERVWIWNAQWQRPHGTACEAIVLPDSQAVKLPDNTDFAAGACMGIPGLTAVQAVHLAGNEQLRGKKVLVTGASSAVGHYITHLVTQYGGQVIGTVGSEVKAAHAKAAGAVETVLYKIESKISNELLSNTLLDWRYNYMYEIDGIIVANDAIYERKPGNPEHAFAFKMVLSDQVAEAKVVDVIWAASKDGYLKPRVQIEPINLGGVQITYATGFNGAFINDNKIGIGAIIELIRSGDVIPYIRNVIVPADEPKMPSIPFKWNDTHVDIMLEDIESDETVREKNITGFFRGIGVEGLSTGNVKRIIDAGFDSVPKILVMNINDFLKVEGFKEKTATKLYNGIKEKIGEASLVKIMSASNMFGRGFSEKKIEIIMEAYPDVILSKETNQQKIAKIAAIKGMATKSAEAFVERIPEFIKFINEAGLIGKLSQKSAAKHVESGHPLFGKSIVMTGFRDAALQESLKAVGAKIGASVSSKTFVVLVKDKEEDTGKANEARKLGIPLMTPDEFKQTYF
jgi:NAD-dependent DNA ligase